MKISSRKQSGWVSSMILGLIIGVVLMGITMWTMMPKMMLSVHESRYDTVEETIQKLAATIKANGWSVPAVRSMNKSIEKNGLTLKRQVKLVELCNAKHAKAVLETNPEVSTLMPCSWGVYEGNNGKIYISGMNMGLMGKMFGGNIAKVMGNTVAKEEHKILSNVIRQ